MRTVIFDFDGTLADTSADLIGAANARFRALGHGDLLDVATDTAIAFAGGRAMLRAGFDRAGIGWDDRRIDAEYIPFIDAYRENIMHHTKFYPGALDAVEALKTRGYRVGICTNKPGELARILVERMGIADVFGSLVAADTLPVRKPDPVAYREAVTRAGGDPARSFLVGDTVTDRDTARNAGVPIALVAFGPHGREIAKLEPDALLESYADLPTLAERFLG